VLIKSHTKTRTQHCYYTQGWDEISKDSNEKIWNEKKEQYTGRQKCMYFRSDASYVARVNGDQLYPFQRDDNNRTTFINLFIVVLCFILF